MIAIAARALLTIGLAFVLVACSPSAARRDIPEGTDRIVEIAIDGMHYVPDRIVVKAGELVAFVVTNPDSIPHELYIGTASDQSAHEVMHQAASSPGQQAIPHGGYGIYLEPRETGVVSYRFDRVGEIMLGCHLPGHWDQGMHAIVVVES